MKKNQTTIFSEGLYALMPSAKVFISLMLAVAALCYVSLLAGIWHDTELALSLIVEAYADMGAIELVQHSIRHLFWFFGIFSVAGGLFLVTRVPEGVKLAVSAGIPLLIVGDIASAWLMGLSPFFGGLLFFCGFMLAVIFVSLILLIQWDLWIPSGFLDNS